MPQRWVESGLALALLVLAIPMMVLARAVARGVVARRAKAIARGLGLGYLGPVGSRTDPAFRGISLFREGVDQQVANPMRGTYRGREVVIAEVLDRNVVSAALCWAMVAALVGLFQLIGLVVGAILLIAAPRWFRGANNHLLILFPEPAPGLPDLLLDAPPGLRADGGGAVRVSWPEPWSIAEPDEAGAMPGKGPWGPVAVASPPDPLLERAGRVLVGRRNPWTVQAVGGRLAVWIAGWRAGTRLRPLRSYRAVLDDALSLRSSLDPDPDPIPDGPPAARKSIRAALERIREEPGPNRPA